MRFGVEYTSRGRPLRVGNAVELGSGVVDDACLPVHTSRTQPDMAMHRQESAGQYEACHFAEVPYTIHRFTACFLELYKTIPRDSVRLSSVRPPTVLHTSLDLFLIQLKVVRFVCAPTAM